MKYAVEGVEPWRVTLECPLAYVLSDSMSTDTNVLEGQRRVLKHFP